MIGADSFPLVAPMIVPIGSSENCYKSFFPNDLFNTNQINGSKKQPNQDKEIPTEEMANQAFIKKSQALEKKNPAEEIYLEEILPKRVPLTDMTNRVDLRNAMLTPQEFIDSNRAQNTVYANNQHWNDFANFIKTNRPEETQDLTKMESDDRAKHLYYYFQNVLKKDGDMYNASCYASKISAIRRQIHFLKLPPLTDVHEKTIAEIIKKRKRQSTAAGETAGKHRAFPFNREQMALMRAHGQLGSENAVALRNLVFMNFNLKFGMRARKEMYTGTMSDVIEGPVDDYGIPLWLSLSKRIRKNMQGERGGEDYEQRITPNKENPELCGVVAWMFYKLSLIHI